MPNPVICIGAALVDELFHANAPMLMHTTNEVTVTRSAGGVSRNISHQLSLLNVPVQLISVFGDDADGDWLKQVCKDAGIGLDYSITAAMPTGKYTAIINQDGSMFIIDVGMGRASSTMWTCDLTKRYVEINGDYRS